MCPLFCFSLKPRGFEHREVKWRILQECEVSCVAMSNQRSFKIESFRFPAFVPKKIEYIRFWNKILDRNKTFSISTWKFLFKSFCSGQFSNFLETIKSFILSLKNSGAFWNVLVSSCYHFFKYKRSVLIPGKFGANKNVLILFRF